MRKTLIIDKFDRNDSLNIGDQWEVEEGHLELFKNRVRTDSFGVAFLIEYFPSITHKISVYFDLEDGCSCGVIGRKYKSRYYLAQIDGKYLRLIKAGQELVRVQESKLRGLLSLLIEVNNRTTAISILLNDQKKIEYTDNADKIIPEESKIGFQLTGFEDHCSDSAYGIIKEFIAEIN